MMAQIIDYLDIFRPSCLYDDENTPLSFVDKRANDFTNQNLMDLEKAINSHIKYMWEKKPFPLKPMAKSSDWLNTSRPFSFDELANKVYIIDFFTYCCISCINILPYLQQVEKEYENNPGLAVIGIHSPKYTMQKNFSRLREALERNNIQHPVLNDYESTLYRLYSVSCWPTVFIVGPGHLLLFALVGECEIEKLPMITRYVMKYYESQGVSLETNALPISVIKSELPVPVQAETKAKSKKKQTLKDVNLLFPANVSVTDFYVVVSDTGHNRLLIFSNNLELEEVIGSGSMGSEDGSFSVATFNSPHGTAWYDGDLYVADTGNHSIRRIYMKRRYVSTIYTRQTNASPNEDFVSPWGLCVGRDLDDMSSSLLYICASGSHQIWAYNLKPFINKCPAVEIAGTGRKEDKTSPDSMEAGFAQPSGIAYSHHMPDYLLIADTENATIKSMDLKKGAIDIIVGGADNNMKMKYGDKDGRYRDVKLQHPLSLCIINKETVAFTDTYNHKIKLVNVSEKRCATFDTPEKLCEPSGIDVYQDRFFLVADTNNHRVVKILISESSGLDGEKDVWKTAQVDFEITTSSVNPDNCYTINLQRQGRIFCCAHVDNTTEYEVNEGSWDISFSGDVFETVFKRSSVLVNNKPFLVLESRQYTSEVSPATLVTSEVQISVYISLYDKKKGTCMYKKLIFYFFVNISDSGIGACRLNLKGVIE